MIQWMQALFGDSPWLPPVLWIVTVIIVLSVISRRLYRAWPFITRFVNTINALAGLPGFIQRTDVTLAAQDTKIADIHHEVHYNNGSSVKDAVNRVELGVKGIYDRLDAADIDRRELREDLEQATPHAPARKRAPKPKEQEE